MGYKTALLQKYDDRLVSVGNQLPRTVSKEEDEEEMHHEYPLETLTAEQLREMRDRVNARRDEALEQLQARRQQLIAQREQYQAKLSKATTPFRKTYGAGLLPEKYFAKNRAGRRRCVALIQHGKFRQARVSFRNAWRQLRQTLQPA